MTETLLAFFKALADESRLRIVGLLAQGERSVQELATLLDL
jgi:DNA-binding transcriptional ArsR family regulator